MIAIKYNSNPDAPQEYNHYIGFGGSATFREVVTKEFDTTDQALAFWQNCAYPITTLDEIPLNFDITTLKELDKEFKNLPKLDTMEEYIHNQRDMYNVDSEVEIYE